jgi:hypothetical protein
MKLNSIQARRVIQSRTLMNCIYLLIHLFIYSFIHLFLKSELLDVNMRRVKHKLPP